MRHFKRTALLALWLVALCSFSVLYAQEGTEQEEAQRQGVLDAAAAISSGDFEALDSFLSDEYVVHTPLGDMDHAALIGFFSALRSAMTGFSMERERLVVEGNMAATQFTISGNFDNEFVSPFGVFAPTGQPFSLHVINFFHFNENGEVVEEWAQFDTATMLAQLGAMGAPANETETDVSGAAITQEMADHFVERFDAMFDGPSLEIADEIFAPDFISHHLPLAPPLDLQSFKDYVASFYVGISDLTQEVHQVIIADDRLVLHVSYTGTHDGTLLGIPATGNQVTINGIGIFAFNEDGLATDNWAVIDVGGLLAQIGGLPAVE